MRDALEREHISIKSKGEMDLEITQLNIKADTYYANRCDHTLRELYDEAVNTFRRWHRTQTISLRKGDEHDADTYFDDTFLKLCQRDDIQDFGKTFSRALNVGRLKIGRNNGRRQKRYSLTVDESRENEDGSHTPICEIISELSAELTFIENKKRADQLQLIDSLVNDPSKVDCETKLIASQFREYDSITALSKALGMHHEYVKRKLRKLARHYDANRFGSHRDYLAV